MRLKVAEQFTTIHNYIDLESMILRKGAISAKAGITLTQFEKPMEEIVANIGDTVEIVRTIRPLYSFKAAEAEALLAPQAVHVIIEGGNHAGFGTYGEQAGDGVAGISAEEQQGIVVENVMALWKNE